jgi:autotransporter-associated beta strand protein
VGGFGGGTGATAPANYSPYFGAGGGLAAGGAVFVQQGGMLSMSGGSISGGAVTGGTGGAIPSEASTPASRNGQALGSGIFLQGVQTLSLSGSLGHSLVVSDVIADQVGSGGGPDGGPSVSLAVSGPGSVVLAASNAYSGGTSIREGTLILAAANAAGSGAITFVYRVSSTLRIEQGDLLNPIYGFGANDPSGQGLYDPDKLDLATLTYDPLSTAVIAGHDLAITSGGMIQHVTLADVADGTPFRTAPDGTGGVLVTQAGVAHLIGSGPDMIGLSISQDHYLFDALFTVSVNGIQIGGTQTTPARHSNGETTLYTVEGSFGDGPRTLTVNFLNDAFGGTATTDRNLYVDSITNNGTVILTAAALLSTGPMTFDLPAPPLPQVPAGSTIGAGPDTIGLQISEDAYAIDGANHALFTVSVDGAQIGVFQNAIASHAAGQSQGFAVLGNFGSGPHSVAINFLNDAYGGTPATDRNLYVDAISNGGVMSVFHAALLSQGSQAFQV